MEPEAAATPKAAVEPEAAAAPEAAVEGNLQREEASLIPERAKQENVEGAARARKRTLMSTVTVIYTCVDATLRATSLSKPCCVMQEEHLTKKVAPPLVASASADGGPPEIAQTQQRRVAAAASTGLLPVVVDLTAGVATTAGDQVNNGTATAAATVSPPARDINLHAPGIK